MFSIPLLTGRLAQSKLGHWTNFVHALRLALEVQLTFSEIDVLKQSLDTFVREAEQIYYRGDISRLSFCTSQLHALLHVAENIDMLGPTYVYWQFGVERFVGTLEALTILKSQQNASLANSLCALTNLKYVLVIYDLHLPGDLQTQSAHAVTVCDRQFVVGILNGKPTESIVTESERRLLSTLPVGLPDGLDTTRMMTSWKKFTRKIAIGTLHEFRVVASDNDIPHAPKDNIVLFIEPTDASVKGVGQVLSFIGFWTVDRQRRFAMQIRRIHTEVLSSCSEHLRKYVGTGSRLVLPLQSLIVPLGQLLSHDPRHPRASATRYLVEGFRLEHVL